MRSMEACPACAGGDSRFVGEKHACRVHECGACGALFVRVPPAATGEMRELYDHYYDRAGFVLPPTVRTSLERLVRSAEPFRRTGRWLDVGYGEGGLLTVAEGLGWACYGAEIAPRVLEYGGRCGWIVSSEPATDPRFPRGGFDVVTMIELLEHMAAPSTVLSDAARFLRPGGLLYLTTPNALSVNRRLLGLGWSTVSPPEHLVLWTSRALRRALDAAGFDVRRIRTEGLNPAEIIARVRGRRGRAVAPVDRNQSALALSTRLSRDSTGRALKRTINEALNAFRAGDTLKVWAVRR